MSYETKLSNVSGTAKTTGDVLKVASMANPEVLTGFAVLMLALPVLLLVIFFIYKKAAGNAIGNFWDFLTRPYRNLLKQIHSENTISATGSKVNISEADAKEIADQIYSCFTAFRDDPEHLYAILRNNMGSQADWLLVYGAFGFRVNPKPLTIIGIKNDVDLDGIISSNLTDKQTTTCRQILNAKGIKPNF